MNCKTAWLSSFYHIESYRQTCFLRSVRNSAATRKDSPSILMTLAAKYKVLICDAGSFYDKNCITCGLLSLYLWFQVLDVDSNNVKALYRRSQAYLSRSDFIEAEADMKRARSLEPNNKDLVSFTRKMKTQIKLASQEQAKLYSTMFSKLAKQDLYNDVPVPLDGIKENLDPDQEEGPPKDIASSSQEPAPEDVAKSSST